MRTYSTFLMALSITLGLSISTLCADSAASSSVVGKNWYCTDDYKGLHRFVFSPNGTFTSAFFTPTAKNLKYWDTTAPIRYTIVSPTQIRILDNSFNPPFFTIRYLSSQELKLLQGNSSYACSHVPPPDDTPQNAAAAAAERSAEGRFFEGKWVTKDRLQSVEFFPNGSCVRVSHMKGTQGTDITVGQHKSPEKADLNSDGVSIVCGGLGAFSRVDPNTIEFNVMRADPVTLYRVTATGAPH